MSLSNKTNLETLLLAKLADQPGCYTLAVNDLTSGRRLVINDEPMRSASLIKIFIMIEAFRQAGKGLFDLSASTLISAESRVDGAGTLHEAPPGATRTWLELIELMIVESDNTATNLLIEKLSMPRINNMIARLGCNDTVLRRKMMDFEAAKAGRENITTSSDMVEVLSMLYRHNCLGSEQDEVMLGIMKRQEDKVKLPVLLPPGVVIAHKTGELDGAEHDAGIVYGPKSHYALAIMADGVPDAAGAQSVIAELSRIVYDYLNTMD